MRRFTEEKELLNYLEKSGLNINDHFSIEHIEDYEGPYVLAIGNRQIAVSHKAAGNVFVEKSK